MAAEVKYAGGPQVQSSTSEKIGVARGDAVLWIRVGKSEQLRPVVLTNDQLVRLAYKCLEILNARRAQ